MAKKRRSRRPSRHAVKALAIELLVANGLLDGMSDLMLQPILHPFRERRLLERDPSCLTLELAARVGAEGMYTRTDLRARIIEVYRRCHEESAPGKRPAVLRDLAAHFPGLVFQAEWTRELIRIALATADFSKNGPRSRILRALASGFRVAASAATRQKRFRTFSIEVAKAERGTLSRTLDQWKKQLRMGDATPDWLHEKAIQKAGELVAAYPAAKPSLVEIEQLLQKGHCYDASVLIVARAFNVSERALERNSSLPAKPSENR